MPATPDSADLLGLGAVFTLLFVTLGPLKILGPFVQETRNVAAPMLRQVALRAFVIALVAVVAGGFIGKALLGNWNISVAALEMSGGIIFFLVGLRLVLEQYNTVRAAPEPLPEAPMAAAMRVTFPLVVTPYGIAALIVMLANSPDSARTLSVLAILAGVMVLNLLAMLFARQIMAGLMVIVLQILGAVLGVLQVALAVEMMVHGLQGLGVLPA
ncbi:MAG TPA: MarC family protein [Casimicrobiaceae bacterium]|jgi:multiple antibiotic resistance protein